MKIAQVAPLWESVPPKLYGGTERIVSYLTEELVRLGHEVTLFASGDSKTAARLEAMWPRSLRLLNGSFCYPDVPFFILLERVFRAAGDFDIIHSHIDFRGFTLARRCTVPTLTTLHGRLDQLELEPVFREFSEMRLVSISDAQRRPLPLANWQATVHHGLPRNLYTFHPQPRSHKKYLAFVGRIAIEKRLDHAIEIAKRVGLPLRVAAKVDPADREYFRTHIEPLMGHPLVEYIGEISDAEKDDFIGNAYALLCPYDWPEPFGLVFIEALACGTPVLAYRRGSVPEILEDGVTGFIGETLEDLAAAVERVPVVDRHQCRRAFEERFTAERMAQDYLKVYKQVMSKEKELSASRVHRRASVQPALSLVN